jgi:tRNA threonylcarbamoyladenosine biosynthesis protein TsaB
VLLEEIERAAAAAGGWQEVDLIAAGLGPGSFTGVRIALATAMGLAASSDLPTAGVSTLDAIGLALAASSAGEADGLVVLDARRGELFVALYSGSGECLWGPTLAAPGELAERVGERPRPLRAAGSGALGFRKELARRGVEIPSDADPVHRVAARQICALAVTGKLRGAGPLSPIYLRPPDAVRWRERDTVQTAE